MKNRTLSILALCCTALAASHALSGESLTLTNEGGAGDVSKFSQCNFSFSIPANSGLPAGSVVRIKSITLAQVGDRAARNENDPHSLALNGCRSDAGTATGSIQANATSNCTALVYAFTNDCDIVVGKNYEAAEAADRMDAGKGVTFLHSNGNRWSSGATMQTAVSFVSNPAARIIANATAAESGYYPIYRIEVEVVSLATAWTGSADSSFSNAENWTAGLPKNGESFSVCLDGDKTLDLSGMAPVAAGIIAVHGTGTLTVTGTGDAPLLTADELEVSATVTVNTAAFQPATISFDDSGSVGIGPNGFLRSTIAYIGSMPTAATTFTSTQYASAVTDEAKWNGVVWLKDISGVNNLESNPYGNENSVLRLSNIAGYLKSPGNYSFTNAVPIELTGAGLSLINGNSANDSNKNRFTVIRKLRGSGPLSGNATAPKQTTIVHDASEFSGAVQLNGKCVIFGETTPDWNDIASGKIIIERDADVAVKSATASLWFATAGIDIKGELRAPSLDHFGGGTQLRVADSGTFALTNGANILDTTVDYARIQGTGTLRLESDSFWRTVSTNNFPSSMTLQNELGDGLLLALPNHTYEIGSLSGSGSIRTDWNDGNRSLDVLQATNTTWSGTFTSSDRLDTMTIRPGASSAGTLTLAGNQLPAHENNLVVGSGAGVVLAGTWYGPVSVQEGATISGSGTLNGNLNLADGAVVNANPTLELLTVNGNITAEGALKILLPESVSNSEIDMIPLLRLYGTVSGDLEKISIESELGTSRWRVYRKSKDGSTILGAKRNIGLSISIR